jgi:hypothetical protein
MKMIRYLYAVIITSVALYQNLSLLPSTEKKNYGKQLMNIFTMDLYNNYHRMLLFTEINIVFSSQNMKETINMDYANYRSYLTTKTTGLM